MLKVNNRTLLIVIILFSMVLISGCRKEDPAITMNQDAFLNQNAAIKDNQPIPFSDMPSLDNTDAVNPTPDATNDNENETENASGTPKEIFEAVNETVYATELVRIRTHYSTEENNIIALLEPGDAIKRLGIGEKWSKVEYDNGICYIMSEYLTNQKAEDTATPTPTMEPEITPTEQPDESPPATVSPMPTTGTKEENEELISGEYSFVETLTTLKDTNSLVCVIGLGTSDCSVSYHKKDRNGKWVQLFLVDGDCGSQGIDYQKREGDNKTPAGLYTFTLAFGLKSDPGAFLEYRKITENDYWISDINSPYYNTWVNSSDTPGEYYSEHLIEHNPSYNYALNINYNPNNTPGLGSAVFLHCYNGSGFTTGCIAIPEKNMKTLVKEVDASTRILIVPREEDLSNY